MSKKEYIIEVAFAALFFTGLGIFIFLGFLL